MTIEMTEETLAAFLTDFHGASFVSVHTITEPKMNKKHRETRAQNPYFGRITRHAHRLGMIGAVYENVVENQRVRERHPSAMIGERFEAESLWNGAGEHVSSCLVRHRGSGKLYMVLYPRQDGEGVVQVRSSEWRLDGNVIDHHALLPYLPPVKEGTNRQETERPIAWRVIELSHIETLNVCGETYRIIH